MNEEQAAALAEAEDMKPNAKNIKRLGDKYSPEIGRWAISQWQLRRKATEKFARANKMLFTRAGLEMATHGAIAAYHASLFPPGAEVLDATCGIGSDLVALGARGPVIGIDTDSEHVFCARHNLALFGFEGKVGRGDALEVLKKGWDYVFCDPGRRDDGRRHINPDDFNPPPDELAFYFDRCKRAVMKLSPMMRDEYLHKLGGDIQFVSFGRECREALTVFPGSGQVSAVHIESGKIAPATPLPGTVAEPDAFLHEADPAMIRAHAMGALGLPGVGDSNGYLSSRKPMDSPWLRSYEVLWRGPWRVRSVKDVLIQREMHVAAVKKRGVPAEPASVIRQLDVPEGNPVILALYKEGPKVAAVLMKPYHP